MREIASRRRGALALGIALAHAGVFPKIAYGVALLTVGGALVVALLIARNPAEDALALVPGVTAAALGWGAGVLLAFGAAMQSMVRDWDDGVRALFVSRGFDRRAYLAARMAGLAVVLAMVVGGGALVTGLGCLALARRAPVLAMTAGGTGAAVAYGLGFAAVLAPLAFAALGARSRAGGYLWLLALLFLPEVAAGITAALLPQGWGDVTSIPSALDAVRLALTPGHADALRLLRAVVVLVLFVLFTVGVSAQQLADVDRTRLR